MRKCIGKRSAIRARPAGLSADPALRELVVACSHLIDLGLMNRAQMLAEHTVAFIGLLRTLGLHLRELLGDRQIVAHVTRANRAEILIGESAVRLQSAAPMRTVASKLFDAHQLKICG